MRWLLTYCYNISAVIQSTLPIQPNQSTKPNFFGLCWVGGWLVLMNCGGVSGSRGSVHSLESISSKFFKFLFHWFMKEQAAPIIFSWKDEEPAGATKQAGNANKIINQFNWIDWLIVVWLACCGCGLTHSFTSLIKKLKFFISLHSGLAHPPLLCWLHSARHTPQRAAHCNQINHSHFFSHSEEKRKGMIVWIAGC